MGEPLSRALLPLLLLLNSFRFGICAVVVHGDRYCCRIGAMANDVVGKCMNSSVVAQFPRETRLFVVTIGRRR